MLLRCDVVARSLDCSVTHPHSNSFNPFEKKKQKSELRAFDNHFVQEGVYSEHSSWIAGSLQPLLQVLDFIATWN